MDKNLYGSPWSRMATRFAEAYPALKNQMNERFQMHLKSLESMDLPDKIKHLQKQIEDGNKLERFYVLRICTPNEELRKKDIIELNRMYKDWLQELKEQADNEPTIALPEGMTVAAIAIMHVYWGEIDPSKKITKTNKEKVALQYKRSSMHNTIHQNYTKYQEFKDRVSRFDKKVSFTAHVARYEAFLPILKEKCLIAFEQANLELKEIKAKNRQFH